MEVCDCGRIAAGQVVLDGPGGGLVHPPECTEHALETRRMGGARAFVRYRIVWLDCSRCGGETDGIDGQVCPACEERTENDGRRMPTICRNVPARSKEEPLVYGQIIHGSTSRQGPEATCFYEIMVVGCNEDKSYDGIPLASRSTHGNTSVWFPHFSLGGSGYHIPEEI